MKQIKNSFSMCRIASRSGYLSPGAEERFNLERTVVVENQYNPEVMDAFKVNVLPKVEERL